MGRQHGPVHGTGGGAQVPGAAGWGPDAGEHGVGERAVRVGGVVRRSANEGRADLLHDLLFHEDGQRYRAAVGHHHGRAARRDAEGRPDASRWLDGDRRDVWSLANGHGLGHWRRDFSNRAVGSVRWRDGGGHRWTRALALASGSRRGGGLPASIC